MIALNITPDSIKLAEISRENGTKIIKSLRQFKADLKTNPESFHVSEMIREFIQEESPKSLQTLLVVNSQALDYRDFSFPFDSRKKVTRAIDFEVAAEYPPEEYVLDHIKSITRKPGKNAYLAAMLRKETLDSQVRQAREVGLQIIGITADVSVLGNFFRDKDEALVMEMNESLTLFALYIHGTPVLIRDIPMGLENIWLPAENRPSPEMKILISEIKRTIHSFRSKTGLDLKGIHLTGKLYPQKEIIRALDRSLIIDFIDRTPEGIDFEAEGERHKISIYASLLGAAEWKSNGGAFNFLKDQFLDSDPVAVGRQLFRWGIVLFFSFFLTFLLTSWLHLSVLEKRKGFLDRSIRQTFVDTFPGINRIVDEVKQAGNLLDSKKRKAGGGNLSSEGSLLDSLDLMSRAIPQETNFQITNLFWESGKLDVNGRTDSFKTVNVIQKTLVGLKPFSAVQISNAKSAKEGQHVNFTITIRLAK